MRSSASRSSAPSRPKQPRQQPPPPRCRRPRATDMALNLNRVMIAGNLTRDPQVRFFANERAVADFGLAINRKYKTNDGQMKEETTFVDIEAWGRTAEL